MKKKIAKIWCKALRSGEYKQDQHVLHNKTRNTFCCLGVLCELAVKAGVEVDVIDIHQMDTVVNYDGDCAFLPESVQKWAGMESTNGWIKGSTRSLSSLNDSGLSFNEIADHIEAHVEDL